MIQVRRDDFFYFCKTNLAPGVFSLNKKFSMEKMERLAAKDYQSISYLKTAKPELKVYGSNPVKIASRSRKVAKIVNLSTVQTTNQLIQKPKGEIRILTVTVPRNGISGLL